MNILVTGAAGFIGFHVVKKLISLGHKVVGLDNLNDYYSVDLKYARLEHCGINRKDIIGNKLLKSSISSLYSFQKLDITDYNGLVKLFNSEKFSHIIHLAAQAGVRYSLENPQAYVQSNLVGFVNILECCRYHNIKHLVYASSSSIYGMSDKIPFNEEDRVDHPISLYAATKKSNELLAHTYSHLYKLPTTGLRFFTVYGPWGRPDMAPILFADAISTGQPIKVFNNGEMQRDFTYVDDIVEGVVRILNFAPKSDNEYPFYRLLNIGNSKPIQLLEFINELETELGKKALLQMFPMQPGDVKITFADTTKLQNLINYKPVTTLKQGVKSFVRWYTGF